MSSHPSPPPPATARPADAAKPPIPPHKRKPPAGLPPWVAGLGGAFLAGVAGYINTVILAVDRIPVTHVSGSFSRLSKDIAAGDDRDAFDILALVGSFIAGAAISGLLIGGPKLRAGRRYGIAMLVEAAVIAAAAAILARHPLEGMCLAAAAAGIQNGLASSYSGLIIRTTHMTGIATDLGFLVGRWLRSRHAEPWKFVLLFTLLVSFFVGGLLGAFAAHAMHADALWLPAAAVALTGASYFAWRRLSGAHVHREPPKKPAPH